jgi:hypothetical protein
MIAQALKEKGQSGITRAQFNQLVDEALRKDKANCQGNANPRETRQENPPEDRPVNRREDSSQVKRPGDSSRDDRREDPSRDDRRNRLQRTDSRDEPRRDQPNGALKKAFLPWEGIDPFVINADLHIYLGPNATLEPGVPPGVRNTLSSTPSDTDRA